jgi:peptidoglycan hydrolase-like protein with peptidoglycan-binding domain
VSHALPGIVKRYELSKLPDLVSSGPDIVADAGAHHMIFYPTGSGRKVIAVQNNLLNLGNAGDNDPTDIDFIAKVNAHTVTVHDLETGDRLASVNFKERYNKGIGNIDGLFGSGFVHHH